jgi:hypothetical protein
MPLSEGALSTVRNWIGVEEPPTDLELHATFDAGNSPKAIVEGIFRRWLAELINPANPAQIGAAGVITLGTQANIAAIQKELDRLRLMPDDLGWDDEDGMSPFGIIGVQRMVRVGYRR